MKPEIESEKKVNFGMSAGDAQYRRMVETMSGGLGVINEYGRFSYVNGYLAEILGYPVEEIVGKLAVNFTDESSQKILVSQLSQSQAVVNAPHAITWRRKDEVEVITQVSAVPLFSGEGEYEGSLVAITDISKLVQSSHTLEQRADQRTKALEMFLEVSQEMTEKRELEPLLRLIVERLKAVVAFDYAIILSEEEDRWRILTQSPAPLTKGKNFIAPLSPQDIYTILEVFQDIAPVVINDTCVGGEAAENFLSLMKRLFEMPFIDACYWLGLPLLSEGNLMGMVILGSIQPVRYSNEQINVSMAFANQISLALEKSHLYWQIRETVAAEERSRLARDLHDSVTQVLFSASLVAEVLPQRLRRDPESALQSAAELRRLTRGALAEIRTMLLELRPTGITKTPLGELLTQLTEAITSRTELPFQLYIDNLPPLPSDIQTAFYRIAQEALNNVVKHSYARQVMVSLSATPPIGARPVDGWVGEIRMVVKDDGVGFMLGDPSIKHMGLGIMQERAAAIDAIFNLISHPGQGTEVTLIWHN